MDGPAFGSLDKSEQIAEEAPDGAGSYKDAAQPTFL
jgi:hypothetical protein